MQQGLLATFSFIHSREEEGMSEAVVSHAAADLAMEGVVAPSKVQEWNHGKFLAR